MLIQINNFSSVDQLKWASFIESHKNNTIYQTPSMYEFYKAVEFYTPYIFIVKNEVDEVDGVLLAVLIKESDGIKGLLSSRVLIFGGPIISQYIENKKEVLDALLTHLVKILKNKSIFIQFRNFFGWNEEEINVFSKHGFVFRDRQNILLKLKSRIDVLRNMSESKRRQIRIATKNGSTIRPPNSIDEVKSFYSILKDLYKNQIRKPLPDFSFFEEFYKGTKKGLGIIKLVVFNNEIIGGVLAPITHDETIYYWYVVGLDREYKNNYPSVMAVWALIDYGLNHNIKKLDFMGIGKENQNYGVRDFKMRFSKETIDYGRFGRRNNKLLYRLAEFGYNILREVKKV